MKKIKITQLEGELLIRSELMDVQGGYYWCLCTLFDRFTSDAAAVGSQNPEPSRGSTCEVIPPPRPPQPYDCLCMVAPDQMGYGGDSGSAYMN